MAKAAAIYLIEDDESIRELVLYALESAGYAVRGFADGGQFWQALAEGETPGLILLDIMLPGEDGLTILRRLKASARLSDTPVIMLTAKAAEYDKVRGLDLGADDYLVKPFHFEELLARIRNLTGRRFIRQDVVVCRGSLRIDTGSHQVYVRDQRLKLTAKETQILETLALHEGKRLSAETIISQVWGEDEDLFSNAFKVHLSSLRRKLATASGEDWIECQRGLGYCLKENPNEKA